MEKHFKRQVQFGSMIAMGCKNNQPAGQLNF
jgi:hypothetical protein